MPCDTGTDTHHSTLISASSTDAHVNQGPILNDSLYFWEWSRSAYGYGFSFASATFSGDIRITGFVPAPDAFTTFQPPGSLGWTLCNDRGYWLVGRLIVEQPVAVDQPTWGRMRAPYR
ncbi:MAG: hypothetical protein U0167_17280 [bacterium]